MSKQGGSPMEQFFRLFKRVAKQGKWEVQSNGYLRHKNGWCPLAFLGSRVCHHGVALSDFETPGKRLGLSREEARTIAHAADRQVPYRSGAADIRTRLLSITGLATA